MVFIAAEQVYSPLRLAGRIHQPLLLGFRISDSALVSNKSEERRVVEGRPLREEESLRQDTSRVGPI